MIRISIRKGCTFPLDTSYVGADMMASNSLLGS